MAVVELIDALRQRKTKHEENKGTDTPQSDGAAADDHRTVTPLPELVSPCQFSELAIGTFRLTSGFDLPKERSDRRPPGRHEAANRSPGNLSRNVDP